MDYKKHYYRMGSHSGNYDSLPESEEDLEKFIDSARKQIEPWLSAVFQAEHFNLLLGSGFTTAIGVQAGASATGMGAIEFGSPYDKEINAYAAKTAELMNRGEANIEDQLRSALAVFEGLKVIDKKKAEALKTNLEKALGEFLASLLETENGIAHASSVDKQADAEALLQSFLLSFASRSASRERLHVFTTNYDRLIEHGCDLTGLRIIDRFVGALNPVFRSSRIEIDMHYNPPGIRGEPRFMEGIIRLTKLHGSLDWHYDPVTRRIKRLGLPFGASKDHSDLPKNPIDTVMIYPNSAKDIETTEYPYAELFRDMAAALCRPNAVVVTYGYGFGDEHINRVLLDMLSIPSTHIVIIARSMNKRIQAFLARTREAQTSILLGAHFADIENLAEHYLPKPTLDYITGRMTELLKHRPMPQPPASDSGNGVEDLV